MPEMTAVASFDALPIDHPDALVDVTVDEPDLRPHDVLVRVEAVSVNPVDMKVRQQITASSRPVVLGFDGAGTVEATGAAVTTLAVGDEVWYAGDISRNGSNAQLQAVDERIASRKPTTLSFAQAAALPLTTITAWETLFERFALTRDSTGDLLIIGGAGGVGSIMIQLAKKLTDVRVVATASRPESRRWALDMGADEVIDHHDLLDAATGVAPDGFDYLFTPYSAGNIDVFAEIVRPFGHITAIDEPPGLDLVGLKAKSIAWHWELMFTRPLFGYDLIAQQRMLTATAALCDSGVLRTTLAKSIGDFNAAGIREAHRDIESGQTIGKVVIHR
jgi:NADPH:quinone reductase